MANFITPPRQYLKPSIQPGGSSSTASTAVQSTPASAVSFQLRSPSTWKRSKRSSIRLSLSARFRWAFILLCLSLTVYVWQWPTQHLVLPSELLQDPSGSPGNPRRYASPNWQGDRPILSSPENWLRENSNNAYAFEWEKNSPSIWMQLFRYAPKAIPKPKAALISLVRNEELEGIMQSMRQLEHRWNRKYRYPWIFFNEKPFSDEFKAATSNLTSAPTFYELIPSHHWSTPSHISRTRYTSSLDYLGTLGVGKASLPSYRHMCRWNSGFFYKHLALASYNYYWRVEPDVHFFCDIPYDPFRFLAENKLVYGFNMVILDDARSFPGLWRQTRTFMERNPDLVHQEADLDWLMHQNTGEYNGCQFFSNFEIGDLNFFREEANEKYFQFLDDEGGFYYERFGDAPIHTLSLAMFAPKDRLWFFRDIGYQHNIARHCPPSTIGGAGACACAPTGLDENFYKLVPMESPQQKPDDSCVRLFLGGKKWLGKKEGWSAEAERAFGGSGYGGYVLSGNE